MIFDSKNINFNNKNYKKCDKKCTCSCDSDCELTTKGTYCAATDYVLSKANLPYDKCQKFPKLIRKFIESIGLCNLIIISEIVPEGGDKAQAINDLYSGIENFTYKGLTYNMRLTLTKTDGTVIYDSVAYTSDSNPPLQLHTTRMEIQRATEKEWGAMKRSSSTVPGTTYVYASIWVPEILLLNSVEDPNRNTEVLNFRLGFQVDEYGIPIPIVL